MEAQGPGGGRKGTQQQGCSCCRRRRRRSWSSLRWRALAARWTAYCLHALASHVGCTFVGRMLPVGTGIGIGCTLPLASLLSACLLCARYRRHLCWVHDCCSGMWNRCGCVMLHVSMCARRLYSTRETARGTAIQRLRSIGCERFVPPDSALALAPCMWVAAIQ